VASFLCHEWHEISRITASVSPAGCRLYLHPNIDINPVAEVSYFRHLQCQSYYKERQNPFVPIRVIRGLFFMPGMARNFTNKGTWFFIFAPLGLLLKYTILIS